MAAVLWLVGACGGGVKPLDPKDPSLPLQTRQWVADAEDGLIAARVRLQRAESERDAVQRWADDLERRLARAPGPVRKALGAMLDAHQSLHALSVRYAEAGQRFAEAKYHAINAEQAVKLDAARYDLKALRGRAQRAQDDLRRDRKLVWEQRERVEAATNAWWGAYAEYVAGGGDTRALWIGNAEPIVVTATKSAKD